MSNSLGKMLLNLGVNTGTFDTDLGRSARNAEKRAKQIKKSFDAAFKLIVTQSVVASLAIGKMVSSSVKAADNIQKLSQRLGASTEFLSEMRHATDLTGVGFNNFTTGLQRMTRRIAEAAATGKGEAVPALKALGVEIESIANLSPDEQFLKLADAMEGVESQGERVRLAMKLFDTEGVALIQTMEGGSKAINEYREEAEEFGLSISQHAADAASRFNDELSRLGARFTGIKESIGNSLIPAMTELSKQMNSGDVVEADTHWQGLETTLASVYGGTLLVKEGFATLGKSIGLMAVKAKQAFDLLSQTTQGFFARLKRGNQIIVDAVTGDFSASDAMAKEVQKIESAYGDLIKSLTSTSEIQGFSTDIEKSFSKIFEMVDKLRNAFSNNAKEFKKGDNQLKKTSKGLGELGKSAGLSEKELDKLGDTYQNILDRFLTPLEKLNKEYEEQKIVIEKYQKANLLNFKIWLEAEQALDKLNKKLEKDTKALDENQKAIDESVKSYDEMMRSLREEIELIGLKGTDLTRAIATQDLARIGIDKATLGQDEYNKMLEKYLGLLEQINKENGAFGNGIESFGDLLKNAFDGGNLFDDLKKGFDNLFDHTENRAANLAQGFGSIADFANQIFDSYQSHSGKDSTGQALATINDLASSGQLGEVAQGLSQIASFIDSITGGKLFGTDFVLESAQINIGLGQDGFTGSQSQTSVRQRSWFRGREWQTLVEDLDQAGQDALNAFYQGLINAIEVNESLLGVTLPQIITGSFQQNFNENGDLVSEFSEVLGRMWNETLEQFQLRIGGENLIAIGDLGLGGGSEIFNFAEQFRHSAQELANFADFAINAVESIQSGSGLFDSFTDLANITIELQNPTESLTEAFTRISQSVLLLESSLDIMGQTIDIKRMEFVRFASDIVEAAGGLEQAAGLWQSYFNTFYSTQELLEQQLASALDNRNELLGNLGLRGSITQETFRELFESILPTLSAEAVVQWLEAAEALGLVIDLTGQLSELQDEAIQEQLQRQQELRDFMAGFIEAIKIEDLTDFQLEIRNIKQAMEEQISTAISLGASEKELSLIRRFADRQYQNAIKDYKQSIIDLSNDIFGTIAQNQADLLNSQLAGVNEQISLLEQQQSAAQQAADAAINAYNAQQAALESIAEFAESLLTSQFSPLNPAEQLAIAQQQFDDAIARANRGDLDAGLIQSLAQTLLGLGQTNFASGQQNTDIFNATYEALRALGLTAGGSLSGGVAGVNPELEGLYQQQREYLDQLADLEQANNLETTLAQQQALFDMLEDLAEISGQSIQDLADELNIPLQQLIETLGINLNKIGTDIGTALIPIMTPAPPPPVDTTGSTIITTELANQGDLDREELRSIKASIDSLKEVIETSDFRQAS